MLSQNRCKLSQYTDFWLETGMVYFEEYVIIYYLMLIIYVNELIQY